MEIQKGKLSDIADFVALLQFVRSGMEHPEWLYIDPPEEVRCMFVDGDLEFWTAKECGHLAGAFSVIYPGLTEMNYGHDLEFTEKDLLKVVCMDTIVVHPAYRGRNLQHKLMQSAEKEVCRQGDCILLCTVHPDNHYSLKNILNQGYSIQKVLKKYGSVRYILRKDIFQKNEKNY